jgi:tRNA pseudouridine13 synthase
MDYRYLTTTKGLGGRIKQLPEDFIVEEAGEGYTTTVKYLPDKKIETIDWKEVFEKRKPGEDHLILDMEKHNVSTMHAISEMSRFLRLSKSRFGYAGLKDKRSISSQKISLYDPTIDRLSKFYFKDIKTYNPLWSSKKIDIGDLEENKFTITIRQIQGFSEKEVEEIILKAFKEIEEKGLINYFGEQRFGGSREITAKVGKELLYKNYKEAILLYLTSPSEYESEEMTLARKDILETKDFKKWASSFPSRSGFEVTMLNHLANNPEDYLGAFKALSKSMQFLFLHAYQSYLFNEIINLRIDKGYFLEPLEGDKIINGKIHLQLFGHDSKFLEGKAGEVEKEIFKKEKVDFKHFFNRDYSVLSCKGDFRPVLTFPKDLKFLSVSLDDLNQEELPGSLKATVSFTLDKGQYATVLIRELIKLENIG